MRRPLLPALALALLACSEPPPTPEPDAVDPFDATTDALPDVIPACQTEAHVFGMDKNDQVQVLEDGVPLSVARGFQGFIFLRVGLRTTGTLSGSVKLKVRVQVAGSIASDVTATFAPVPTKPLPKGGSQTAEVPFFINDVPIIELRKGPPAAVSVWTIDGGCQTSAKATVTLVQDNYMGEDSAMWQTDFGGVD